MSELKPVFRVTLSEQVAQQIAAAISSGRWKDGDRLPSESELCKMLHIGRSTLREALRSLAFVGMVRMRAGEGTYVAHGPSKFLERMFAQGMLATEQAVTDLCDTRIVLETELAALAAQKATEQELRKLASLLREMELNVNGASDGFLKLDLEFHLAIADASKNRIMAQLLRTIRQLLEEYIVKSLQLTDAPQLACEGHAKILEGLKDRSPRKARAAMREHLRKFQRGYKLVMAASEHKTDGSQQKAAGGRRPRAST
jgi:GntR family transcriptional repressor for pyruvate dehydrogenase complex